MKIKFSQKIKKDNTGTHYFDLYVGKGSSAKTFTLAFDEENEKNVMNAFDKPILLKDFNFYGGSKGCVYKDYLLVVEEIGNDLDEEDSLRIKHFVLKKEKELEKITKEVEAFENFDKTQIAKREKIPDSVRLFVWQRDEGKCVKCGNKEKLEFDHIIPVIEGGSNTERNIQLLCESCNRTKGRAI